METSRPPAAAAEAAGRLSYILSLLAFRRLLLLLHSAILLLLYPFRWRPSPFPSAPEASGSGRKAGKSASPSSTAVVVRVPAAMAAARRQREAGPARRELATRRAREAGREPELVPTARGEVLFTQSWWAPAPTGANAKPKGLLVLLHGLNEHSGRYDHFARRLNENGIKMYGMDWTGHGGSDGLHGYVQSLDHAVNDLKMYLKRVLADNPGLPCFLFGHSTGAAIILKAVLDREVESYTSGVILTSPAVRVQPCHPIIKVMAPIFSFIAPRYQYSSSYRNGPPVSRDPDALRSKYSDPLVFTGSIRTRTGYEILCLTTYLQQHLHRINIPLLVLHGAADMVTDPEGSQRLYEKASSADKSIKLYEGLLHDLLIEPEKELVIRDILEWLNSRT